MIGLIGNTGNVLGTSCPEHPGTHLHFVMYGADGNAHVPEPMERCVEIESGATPCRNFTRGRWYASLSDTVAPPEEPSQPMEDEAAEQRVATVTFLRPGSFLQGLWWLIRDGALAMWDGISGLFGRQRADLLASLPISDVDAWPLPDATEGPLLPPDANDTDTAAAPILAVAPLDASPPVGTSDAPPPPPLPTDHTETAPLPAVVPLEPDDAQPLPPPEPEAEAADSGSVPAPPPPTTYPAGTPGVVPTVPQIGDASGGASDAEEAAAPPAPHVVINEIAWMGTAANARDEWIELANAGGEDIDLDGWKLFTPSEDGTDRELFSIESESCANTRIAAGGFFLIERTDDDTVADVAADCRGPFGGNGLRNDPPAERVELRDAEDNLIDVVQPDERGWFRGVPPAADGESWGTMARSDPDGDSNDPDNWFTSPQPACPAHDADGNPINGTPRTENGADEVVPCPEPDDASLLDVGGESAPYDVIGTHAVAAGRDVFFVAWYEGDASDPTVRAARISRDGRLLDSPALFLVRPESPGSVRLTAPLAVWDAGTFRLFLGLRPDAEGPNVIAEVRLTEDGRVLDDAPRAIVSEANFTLSPFTAAALPSGGVFLAAWDGTSYEGYLRAMVLDDDGVATHSEAIMSASGRLMLRASLLTSSACAGAWCVLVWATEDGVRAMLVDTSAASWRPPEMACITFSDRCPGTLIAAPHLVAEERLVISPHAVLPLPDGFFIAWAEQRSGELRGRMLGLDGALVGDERLLAVAEGSLTLPFLSWRGPQMLVSAARAEGLSAPLVAEILPDGAPPARFAPLGEGEPFTAHLYAPSACSGNTCVVTWASIDEDDVARAASGLFAWIEGS